MTAMMIRAEGLGKCYALGGGARAVHAQPTFADTLRQRWGELWGRVRGSGAGATGTFWALRDVDLSMRQGEVVGVIGHNGAGKSTLLKVLSRITDPTTGRAELFGRVGSLLEVGTGFHPELSGRENIYLNGAILGMTRGEIRRKFDEIVAFSEIEQFLDTPAKRYSSGMYVRLAFAVAAHLEPEILIVDEVLAVGDMKFQQKCLEKMKTVARDGRTVLFVSHNMGAIETLCTRGVVMSKGRVIFDGGASQAVQSYLSSLESSARNELSQRTDREGQGPCRVRSVEVNCLTPQGEPGAPMSGRPLRITVGLTQPIREATCVLNILDNHGQWLIDLRNKPTAEGDGDFTQSGQVIHCEVDDLPLVPGRYRVDVEVWESRVMQDCIRAAAHFMVAPGVIGGRSVSEPIRMGRLVLPSRWSLGGSATEKPR